MSALVRPVGILTMAALLSWWETIPGKEYGYNGSGIPTWDSEHDAPGPTHFFVGFRAGGQTEADVVPPFAEALYDYLSRHPGERVRVRLPPTLEDERHPVTEEAGLLLHAKLLCSADLDAAEYPAT